MTAKKKISLIALVAVSLVSAAAHAQTVFQKGYEPAPDAYVNLPGVKDPRTLQPKVRYRCHSEMGVTAYPSGPYRDVFGSRGLTVQGYRCTDENGISSFGGNVPTSKDWYPGINPSDPTF
mgnify:CR=1 FL=1